MDYFEKFKRLLENKRAAASPSDRTRELELRDTWRQYFSSLNENVNAFWQEFKGEFEWDLLPFSFLFDLYNAWTTTNRCPLYFRDKETFIERLIWCIRKDEDWDCPGNYAVATSSLMSKPEVLILVYSLENWENKNFEGDGVEPKCTLAKPATHYRGLVRKGVSFEQYKRSSNTKA